MDKKKEEGKKLALVLAGGGSRGAYQIGVWKAMRQLGLSIDLVTGISSGALNGALVMQDYFNQAEQLWSTISTPDVIDHDPKSSEDFTDYTKNLISLAVKAFSQGGIKTGPLRRLIDYYLMDQDQLDQLPVKFGLVVTNIETKEIEEYFVNGRPRQEICDLLMASASLFPLLEKTRIGQEDYIDGGYRNHIPLSLAQSQDPDIIVVVDIFPEKKAELEGRLDNVLLVRPTWPLGDMLIFDWRRSQRNIKLGYNDFMKACGHYYGYYYSFYDQGIFLKQNLVKILVAARKQEGSRAQLLLAILKKARKIQKQVESKWNWKIGTNNYHLALLEVCGKLFSLPPEPVYTVKGFIQVLVSRIKQVQQMDKDNISQIYMPNYQLSYQEWLTYFYQRLAPLPDQDRILTLVEQFKQGDWALDSLANRLFFQVDPTSFALAVFIYELMENERNLIQES